MANVFNTGSAAVRHLQKEYQRLRRRPIPGIKNIKINDKNIFLWEVTVVPTSVPYKNHGFITQIEFSDYFPLEPPSVTIKTKIYHPNVGKDGKMTLDICTPENWQKEFDVKLVLTNILDLLNNPKPKDNSGRADVASIFVKNKAEFLKNAEIWTKRFGVKQPLEPKNKKSKSTMGSNYSKFG